MPFNTQRPRSAPRPPQDDLLRLTGLFASQSGKALVGSIDLASPSGDSTVGEKLLALIQECTDDGVPLKFMVFEAREGQRPPYTLNVARGQHQEGRGATLPPRPPRPPQPVEDPEPGYMASDGNYGDLDPNQGPYDDPDAPPSAPTAPAPRPARRMAPRR